jgi:protoheme IX farnesyltransferase
MMTTLKRYWPLIKSLQTALLLITGLTGYMSSCCPIFNLSTMIMLTVSLFLTISGSTVLNMWYDRDIDAKMKRTCWRPLPTERVEPREALIFGLVLSFTGLLIGGMLSPLYALVLFAGLFFDVVIYTLWLKRRTQWSIVWGGISGGMPILAGRVLAVGRFEWIGIVLAIAVLFWIPTHILTFSMRYREDYANAGIPTIPAVYGDKFTHKLIAGSSLAAGAAIITAAIGIGTPTGSMRMIAALSTLLVALAIASMMRPSDRMNFRLFKFASVYMLTSMLLIVIHSLP